jgi:hypothetical protein
MRQTHCINKRDGVGIGRIMNWAKASWIGLGWTVAGLTLMSFPLQAQAQNTQQTPIAPLPPDDVSSRNEFCAAHNVWQQDEQIILGDLPNAPYVVAVPGQAAEQLAVVRQCVPDAFQTDSSLGAYIRAGAFSDRRSAERLSRHLRRAFNLDARVMYWP